MMKLLIDDRSCADGQTSSEYIQLSSRVVVMPGGKGARPFKAIIIAAAATVCTEFCLYCVAYVCVFHKLLITSWCVSVCVWSSRHI